MHKLKQAFGKKDTEESAAHGVTGDTVQPERRRSSIMRQILNPGGDKYEEELHGTTATVSPNVPTPSQFNTEGDPNVRLETNPKAEQKGQGGIVRQILNPGGQKFDETRHGSTTVVPDGVGSSHGHGSTTAPVVPESSTVGTHATTAAHGDRIEPEVHPSTTTTTTTGSGLGNLEYWKK